ncbi:hypothetical protein ACJRO7_018260 [Eucalyptus globulus]|uniref:DUF7890 domain-containing protein n=1 Tax=Eucalyptus globulus TaxID=34317 RepID=A0ABD3KT38_EUCGL
MDLRQIIRLPRFSCFDESWSLQSDHEVAEAKEPLIYRDRRGGKRANNQEKRVMMRVKVKMTKQEARQLLSKCNDGGILEFKDVARELARIPVSRVSVKPMPAREVDYTALKSIPEDDMKEW